MLKTNCKFPLGAQGGLLVSDIYNRHETQETQACKDLKAELQTDRENNGKQGLTIRNKLKKDSIIDT